jgi:Rrf2 family iron-sulfur cluster assembly transcriptional regulator
MRLSTKSRYAVTAMLDLTLNGTRGPVTLSDISDNQSISLSYLEQLFAALRSKGLVRGVRGPGGGYYLGRDAADITVADVICAVDEWVEYTRARAEQQPAETECTTRSLWDDLSNQIFDFVDNISLKELVDQGLARQGAAEEKIVKPMVLSLRDQAAA